MKLSRKILSLLTVLSALAPAWASAQTANVPKYVNFQAVLRDDSGNLIEDGFIDLEFKVLDQDGDELYYELQPGVQVVRSAVNVLIGEGVEPGSSPSAPTGGLPFDALNPAGGTKFLQMKVGNNLPSDNMELGSVPYAMYAQKALGIVPDITGPEVPEIFVTEEELAAAILAHENDTTAHPASSVTITGPFITVTGTTVQQVLQDIDQELTTINSTISNINNIPGILNDAKVASSLARDSEVADAVAAEALARGSSDTALQNQINNLSARMTVLESKPQVVFAAEIAGDGTVSKTYESSLVGSVTVNKVSTGLYTVSFSNSLPNNNYLVVGSGEEDGPSEGIILAVTQDSKLTSGFGFRTVNMSDTHTNTRAMIAVILMTP